ncbi:MAG TPA: hypothetical protein VKN36_10470 [Eudoraea sp.]|nr:hypothetical protein [Eudoraea sp.]
MHVRAGYIILLLLTLNSCYQPERDCQSFKEGTFTFTSIFGGEEKTTTFVRRGTIEIDYFEGRRDTSSVRWINDCEYVVKKLHPVNKAEERAVHMKILSTTDKSYTFEYSIVGDSRKLKGTATRASSSKNNKVD